jgi:glycosyltransferase involved in cell wall biosynthesis
VTSADGPASGTHHGPIASSAQWRAHAAAAQEAVLPEGPTVVTCAAPYGQGGLGRHLRELVEALERGGQKPVCVCTPSRDMRPPSARRPSATAAATAVLKPALRFSPAWRLWSESVGFDADATRRLPQGRSLLGFNGTALRQLQEGARRGYAMLALVSATSHFARVVRQHDAACRAFPLERPWSGRLLARNLAEYERAERIFVSTHHIASSFVEEGISEEKLCVFPLTPDPRFVLTAELKAPDTFDVVYVGALSVAKGVPLLVESIRRLDAPDLRLVLVGGWGTRGMRRYVQRACAADARVIVRHGDPLEHMRAARLYVHPSYEDGFGYAPAEALACGVPVIVSENTGMKELVEPGRTGVVVPTGSLEALTETIDAAYRGEILGS